MTHVQVVRLTDEQRQLLLSMLTMSVLLEAWFQQSAPDAGIVLESVGPGANRRVHALTGLRSLLGRWAEQGMTDALGLNDLDPTTAFKPVLRRTR